MAYIDCENCYHGKVCQNRRIYHDSIVACEDWQPTADVVPKSEIATQLIDEILEGLQYEIDREDTLGRKAWDEGDIRSYQLHQYAEEKLDTLLTALSLIKGKYTDKKDGDE